MPRQARVDLAGSLHHIICRGIERRNIFIDDSDRDDFVARLVEITTTTSTRCFAWALLNNHFHVLLQTGLAPISHVMQRLLTGYPQGCRLRCDQEAQRAYSKSLCSMIRT